MKKEIDISDLQKIEMALHNAYMYFVHRDETNARVHCGKPINSPITSQLEREWNRLNRLMQPDGTWTTGDK